MSRDDHDSAVDLQELGRFGIGRARHARQFVVEAEAPEGDRGEVCSPMVTPSLASTA